MADNARPLILVVEDDPGVAILQRRRLERAAFRVNVAADLDAALAALGDGGIDLVVMDYRLGSTTGLDLHRRMKAAGYDVPVIIVSGAMEDATVIEAMRAGIRDVVVKSTEYLDYLPDAVRNVLSQAAAVVPERPLQADRGAGVLIVEDDPGLAALERRHLERAGYEVEVATTAEEALRAVQKGDVHLAVLDLRLGGSTSGIDLYERFKAEGWNIPAIIVTAFPDQAAAIRALRAGIRDFVPKSPQFLEYLPSAVNRVAAQVRVERKLVESELRLASIVGTTMDAIVMCDEQRRVVLFNRAAEEMFDCPAAQALTQRLDRFVPDLKLGDPAARSAAPPGSVRQRVEVDGVRAGGGPVPIEVSVSDVVVHGNRLFTVIARDVSERRRIEGELREADRRKDEFLGMLAHELRNPLAAIMNAGEVLHRTLQQDGRALKLTAVVRRQTRALARMVDDLLDVSRVTLGKIQLAREPLLLTEIVRRSADSARDAIGQGNVAFDVLVEQEPVWLNGDATRLEQVLANLLNNALKFTPAGGRITLEARREADIAVIRVRDTGVGMDKALLAKVFDLFVQGDTSLDRSNSGLGIGLALVRQIVTLHGGYVEARSDGPGRGSEFVIRLPATPDEGASPRDDAPVEAVPGRRMRVLVVDDQPDVADSVAQLIETFGHEARAVYTGPAALEASRSDLPDVMFVDIGMPGMTGYELARQVRLDRDLSRVQLVALTGYGRAEDRARVLEAGFDQHLTKPIADSRLQAVLLALTPPA
jgi:PAS domain S-box-containing protein